MKAFSRGLQRELVQETLFSRRTPFCERKIDLTKLSIKAWNRLNYLKKMKLNTRLFCYWKGIKSRGITKFTNALRFNTANVLSLAVTK